MKHISLILLFISSTLYAKTIRIAILDTGYYTEDTKSFKSCDNFKYDKNFTSDKNMFDFSGHGQNILHLVTKDLNDVDYCIIIVKTLTTQPTPLTGYIGAWIYAKTLNVDIINASFAGEGKNETETKIVKQILNSGTKIVVAAGNRKRDLDLQCNTYPVCADNRIISVGNLNSDGKTKNKSTNYGSYVKVWEVGTNVEAGGLTLSGTSQATAITTNKLIKEMTKDNNK